MTSNTSVISTKHPLDSLPESRAKRPATQDAVTVSKSANFFPTSKTPIPKEIIALIGSFADPFDYQSLNLLSRDWHQVISTAPECWGTLLKIKENLPEEKLIALPFKDYQKWLAPALQKTMATERPAEDLFLFLNQLSAEHRALITAYDTKHIEHPIDTNEIKDLFPLLPSLNTFTCVFPFNLSFISHFPLFLESLTLKTKLHKTVLSTLFQRYPQLRHLHLAGCELHRETIPHLPPSLTELYLEEPKLRDDDLIAINRRSPLIKKLTLNNLKRLRGTAFNDPLPHLEELTLHDTFSHPDGIFHNTPNLKAFTFIRTKPLQMGSFTALPPHLEQIALHIHPLSAEVLDSVLALGPRLRKLNLAGATGNFVESFVRRPWPLDELILNAQNLNQQQIDQILNACSRLKSLNLIAWSNLTDHSFDSFPVTLEKFTVSSREITSRQLEILSHRCPQLKTLRFSRNCYSYLSNQEIYFWKEKFPEEVVERNGALI